MTDSDTSNSSDNDSSSDSSSDSGSGGYTGSKVLISSDNIDSKSKDNDRIDRCISALEEAGYEASNGGVDPNYHVSNMKNSNDTYCVFIFGGYDAGTFADMGSTYYQNYMKDNNNSCGICFYWAGSKYKKCVDEIDSLERAWDDNFSSSDFDGMDDPAGYLTEHNIDYCCTGEDDEVPEKVVEMVKNGSSGGGGSGVEIVEGFVESGKGSSPQFWNVENYEDPVEINFTNYEITEENPRIKTATFETIERIDLLDGRCAVFITGDCNDFGGIILSHEYNVESGLWKYQCQGFMDRIMANQVNLVCNGGKTAYDWIREILADLGLPDVNLGPIEDYDFELTEEEVALMNADQDLAETSDMYLTQVQDEANEQQQQNQSHEIGDDSTLTSLEYGGASLQLASTPSTISDTSTNTGSDESTDESEEDEDSDDSEESEDLTDQSAIVNPFRNKPKGIYDKKTIGDLIRALIFDYGINIDFYGDINGVPQFEVMDLETWKNTGWHLGADYGFGSDYEYKFDITDIVTQVAIKNVSALNGTGEYYTSAELLGVALEDYVGRMGVVLDNPASLGASETDDSSTEYQDAEGNTYSSDEVLTTNGKPSCKRCKAYNDGTDPTYQTYTKYWHNKCPGCKEEGTLSSSTGDDGEGVTTCSNCNLEFCQFCGYEKKSGNYQLTELFKSTTSSSSSSSSDSSAEEST